MTFPNEPSIMTTIHDWDMTSQGTWLYTTTGTSVPPVGQAGAWTWVFDSDLGQNVTRLTYGPWTVPSGSTYGPGGGYVGVPHTPAMRSFYLRMQVKLSAGWVQNPTGDQKLMQFWARSSGSYSVGMPFIYGVSNPFITVYENNPSQPGYNGIPLGQNPGGGTHVTPPTGVFTSGVWHTIEVLIAGNTPGVADGKVLTWLDGVKQMEVDDMMWMASGETALLNQVEIGALWGGLGGTLSAVQYMDLGPIHLSGSTTLLVGPLSPPAGPPAVGGVTVGSSAGLLARSAYSTGARGEIIKASHRLNPCLDLEADIVAVEAAAVASSHEDWTLALASGGLMVSSSQVDVDAQGVLRIAKIGTPTSIFSNVLASTIKHDFSDAGAVGIFPGTTLGAKPAMELFFDFWPDPAIFTAPIVLSGLTLQLGLDGTGTVTYGGTFFVQFYQFDRQWRRQTVGPPVQVQVDTTFAATGLTTYTFDFSKRNLVFEPGRFGTAQSGPGRTNAGALRTLNADANGISQLSVNKGFSFGLRVTDVGGNAAYLAATDNASLANFDPTAFWRAQTAPGSRAHGPYDPGARRYPPLDLNHDTDGYLLTGAVPSYGARAVTNGFMGYAKAVRQLDAARPVITQPWAVPYHAVTIDTYWNTGTRVIVLDMGKIPTLSIEVRADDVITQNASVTYSLRGSNASNAGAWTTIGLVVDGQILTGTLYQWYEVTITLTATGGGSAPSVLGSDAFGRADSTTSLGTADVGGAWTARQGTGGIISGKGYSVTGADSDLFTLTLASPAAEVGADIATDAIQSHVDGIMLRWVDANNNLRISYQLSGAGAVAIRSRVAGTTTTRMSVSGAVPTSGSSSFTGAATINPSNVVQCLINGVQVGTAYTLTPTEITAFGASLNVGWHLVKVSGTASASTIDNFYAKLLGGSAPTILGSDAFGRADSSTTMGTADIGGAWTAQDSSGTAHVYGLTSGKAYCAYNTAGTRAFLSLASLPDTIQADFATTDIAHGLGLALRYTDHNNLLEVKYLSGAVTLVSTVAGTATTRVTVAQGSTGLPASGSAASFTGKATIVANVVTLFINGVQVGSPYTLLAGEITAFGGSQKAGLEMYSAIAPATNATADNFLATIGSGSGGGVAYATPQVNAFTLTARTSYATTRYDQDVDASSTIDPITGDAGVASLSLSLLKLTRDQRDLATFLASAYSPASIEAQVYAVNRISKARWFLNSYRLESRVPSDLDESLTFLSGLDRLMVNVPPDAETLSKSMTVSAVSVTGSDVQLTFSPSPGLPTITPNTVPSDIYIAAGVSGGFQGVQGYRLVVVNPTSTVANRQFQIITTRATTATSCWITPLTTSSFNYPAVGDVVEIHSDVYNRKDQPYPNYDYAAIYADVFARLAQVPSRYRGSQPGLTGRTTSPITALAPRLQGTSPRTALDVLKELALHCGGCLSWDQGRINFVPIYNDAEPVEHWDERHYVTLDTPQGADRRMPRIYSKYNYDWNAGSFQNESHFTDLDALAGFGLANLYDVTTLADSLCAWSDVFEAQWLANQFLQACSTGVRIWKVSLVLAYPWIQFGDAVTIATDQYTDHIPRYSDGTNDTGLAIAGRTYATGRVIGKNLWGTEFVLFVPGLGAIASSAVTVGSSGGPYDDIPVPLDLVFSPEVRGDASAPVSSILATYTPPDDPYFARMIYSIQMRRTGDASYGAEQVVTGDRLGFDRIPVSPGTDLLITPVTMTMANHALSFAARVAIAVTVPAFAPPTPTISAVAGGTAITYNFTLDPATKYMEVWGRTYATGAQPASPPNNWNASGATKSDTIRNGDGRTFITRPVGTGSEYDSVTFVPFDGNNLPGTPISLLTVKAGSSAAPSAPTAASNTSVTSGSVTNSVTMPASITNFTNIRVYRNGVVYGSDIARTAGVSTAQSIVHSGLGALETDTWQYSGVNGTTGDESTKTTSFSTTTSAMAIPTPSITASYNAGSDNFQVVVTPAGGSPSGVTWHLKTASSSGGSYTEDTSAASTSTTLTTDAGGVGVFTFDYFKVFGVKTGYSNSADSASTSAKKTQPL